ncbi:MAG: FliH/SctL family protein [Caldimicrobium sp.]
MSKIIKAEKTLHLRIIKPVQENFEEEKFFPLIREELIKEEDHLKKEENRFDKDPQEKKGSDQPNLEEIFQRAYEEGYEEGFKKGYEEGFKKAEEEGFQKGLEQAKLELEEEKKRLHKELEQLKERERKKIEEFLKRLDDELEGLILNLDQEILDLSLELAKKLVLKTIETDRDLLSRILREALKYIAEGTEVIVKVNPEEATYLYERGDSFPKNYRIKIVPDPGISKGGLFIETKLGVIDATFEKRWAKLLETLKNED